MASTRSTTDDQDSFSEEMLDHLSQALAADSPEMRDYHVRSALQFCLVQSDRES